MAVRALGAAVAEGEPACTSRFLDSLVVESDSPAIEVDDELDLDIEDPATFILSRAHFLPAIAVESMVGKAAAQAAVVVGAAVASVIVELWGEFGGRSLALDLDLNILIVRTRDVEVEDEGVALEVKLDLAEDLMIIAVGVVLAESPVVVTLVVDIGEEESLRIRDVRSRRSILAGVQRVAVATLQTLGRADAGNGLDLEIGRGAGEAARDGSQDGCTHGKRMGAFNEGE